MINFSNLFFQLLTMDNKVFFDRTKKHSQTTFHSYNPYFIKWYTSFIKYFIASIVHHSKVCKR